MGGYARVRMSVAAEPRPLGHPLPGGREGATVRLRPLLAAEIEAPPNLAVRRGVRLEMPRALLSRSKREWLPEPAFLVEHPGAGPVLIDTGMHASVEVDPRGNLGRIASRLFNFRGIGEGVPGQLRALGIEPGEVHVVVMTHLHTDHASGVSEFPNATFVVDGREWASAAESRPSLRGYHPPQFDHAFDWRTVDYDSELVESLSPFGRSIDLFGDGSVRLLSTPGHSAGHQSVLLRLRGRDALVCGDAAYTRRTIDEELLPLILVDEHLFRRSLHEMQHFVKREPEAVVIPGHDPDVWPTLSELYD